MEVIQRLETPETPTELTPQFQSIRNYMHALQIKDYPNVVIGDECDKIKKKWGHDIIAWIGVRLQSPSPIVAHRMIEYSIENKPTLQEICDISPNTIILVLRTTGELIPVLYRYYYGSTITFICMNSIQSKSMYDADKMSLQKHENFFFSATSDEQSRYLEQYPIAKEFIANCVKHD
jgi:hypothetical protein